MFYSGNQMIKGSSNKDIVFDLRFKKNQTKKPIVIFTHGFKGFKDWGHFNLIADHFANNNYVFVKLNFSHNGTSLETPTEFTDLEAFGNNNFSKEINDLKSIQEHLIKAFENNDEVDTSKIFLIGHSKGGATSIITSNETAFLGTVTWNAVLDIKSRYASHEIEYWQKNGVIYIDNARTQQQMPLYFQLAQDVLDNEERFNIPQIIQSQNNKLLILHGSEDETVSLNDCFSTINKGVSKHVTFKEIKKADHTFGGTHPFDQKELPTIAIEYCEETLNFFSSLV